ncbi:MAG: hypothetical protein JF609_05710 [Verrucomicrobia bacterium]|nr:hypothetical protein [Verrucomicrobiota bacterium]
MNHRFKLFVMMALEFFIWGAWLPLIFGYLPSLGFTPGEQAWILGGTIGWILAAWPFTFILVDWDKVAVTNTHGFTEWLGAVLGSGLTGEKLKTATVWTFAVAGIASLALAAFSFVLPHTPPKKAGEGAAEKLAWLEALKLLKHPFVLVLWLVTLVDSFVHNCYFNWTGSFLGADRAAGGVGIAGNWIMPVMSVGQIAEISTMLILGATLARLGWRATMISICPYLGQKVFTNGGVTDFHGLFLVPMICGLVAAVALALFFHPPKIAPPANAGH